jgi:alkylhydroperoxidase family enzyme
VGSGHGLTAEKILALGEYAKSAHYDDRERSALAYADAMSTTAEVDDELFGRLKRHFSDEELVELTALIAWENASSRFNRALRIPSQGLWKQGGSR